MKFAIRTLMGVSLLSFASGCLEYSAAAGKPSKALAQAPTSLSSSGVDARGHYKKLGESSYLLTLKPGSKVMEGISAFQRQERIFSGSVTGIGVFKNTSLGFYKFNEDGTPAKTHSESHVKDAREVVSFTCILTTNFLESTKPATPAPPHCHIAMAGSTEKPLPEEGGFPVVGGHFIEGEVGVVAEFVIHVSQTEVNKIPSTEFGGKVIDLASDKGASLLPR